MVHTRISEIIWRAARSMSRDPTDFEHFDLNAPRIEHPHLVEWRINTETPYRINNGGHIPSALEVDSPRTTLELHWFTENGTYFQRAFNQQETIHVRLPNGFEAEGIITHWRCTAERDPLPIIYRETITMEVRNMRVRDDIERVLWRGDQINGPNPNSWRAEMVRLGEEMDQINRTCPNCGRALIWREFCEANREIMFEQLKTWWESANIELFCCGCLRRADAPGAVVDDSFHIRTSETPQITRLRTTPEEYFTTYFVVGELENEIEDLTEQPRQLLTDPENQPNQYSGTTEEILQRIFDLNGGYLTSERDERIRIEFENQTQLLCAELGVTRDELFSQGHMPAIVDTLATNIRNAFNRVMEPYNDALDALTHAVRIATPHRSQMWEYVRERMGRLSTLYNIPLPLEKVSLIKRIKNKLLLYYRTIKYWITRKEFNGGI